MSKQYLANAQSTQGDLFFPVSAYGGMPNFDGGSDISLVWFTDIFFKLFLLFTIYGNTERCL